MNQITLTAFFDEFEKIATKLSTMALVKKTFGKGIQKAKAAVPDDVPLKGLRQTAYFRGGKMIKVPHGTPPPIPEALRRAA
jgi:hypothetical protein